MTLKIIGEEVEINGNTYILKANQTYFIEKIWELEKKVKILRKQLKEVSK